MKEVLVTGGTGSFGSAFVRHLLANTDARRVIVYSRGEHAQEAMERELDDPRLRFFIGDVRDLDRLEMAMHNVDTVIHAAALKIVPIAEYNPTECTATNVTGTENVVKAALRTGVKRALLISTDKAVNPINLYGSTKLAAEKTFVAANNLSAGRCAFSVVRYGNVVGSRGSVIPLFKKLKEEGKPLPITDPNMTRFMITMNKAVNIVARTLFLMEGGEIVIPKIPSAMVTEIADLIDPGGERRMIGIRPGEKVNEILMTSDEARTATDEKGCYVIHHKVIPQSAGPMVPDGFFYVSNLNEEWLHGDELKELL